MTQQIKGFNITELMKAAEIFKLEQKEAMQIILYLISNKGKEKKVNIQLRETKTGIEIKDKLLKNINQILKNEKNNAFYMACQYATKIKKI